MKKSIKMLSIAIMAILVVAALAMPVYATSDATQVIEGLYEGSNVDVDGITSVGANIVSIITTIGIIVAVVVLLVIGIKYMMGSAAEKAEYKKTMIPYLVGAVIIFGASAIAKAVISMPASITS